MGIGAILMHSQKRECLAIVWSVKRLKPFLMEKLLSVFLLPTGDRMPSTYKQISGLMRRHSKSLHTFDVCRNAARPSANCELSAERAVIVTKLHAITFPSSKLKTKEGVQVYVTNSPFVLST